MVDKGDKNRGKFEDVCERARYSPTKRQSLQGSKVEPAAAKPQNPGSTLPANPEPIGSPSSAQLGQDKVGYAIEV